MCIYIYLYVYRPSREQGASHLRAVFGRMGFDDSEIVALSGAHTVGRCHAERSGFVGPWTERPLNWDTQYFELLLQCQWEEASAPGTGKPQLACPAHPDLMMLHTDVRYIYVYVCAYMYTCMYTYTYTYISLPI